VKERNCWRRSDDLQVASVFLCSSGLLAAGKLHAAALLCLSFFPLLSFLEFSNPGAVFSTVNQTTATPAIPFSHRPHTTDPADEPAPLKLS